MSLAVQVVFTGLSAGGVYGLVAIGHSVIYRLTGIVHFALGELIGLGAFVTLLVAAVTQPLTQETVSGGRMALPRWSGSLSNERGRSPSGWPAGWPRSRSSWPHPERRSIRAAELCLA
jgi:ABC-type branched-subunit amino acid transport system permease subunit